MFFEAVEKTPFQISVGEALKAKNVGLLKTIFDKVESINFNFLSLDIDGDDVELIASALEDNASVKDIRFMGVKIGDIGAKHIGNLLKINKYITSVIFLNCIIGQTGIKHLSAGIRENKYLESLVLWGNNPFGNVGMVHLCAALADHPSLQGLSMGNDSFDKTGWSNFGNIIGTISKLEHVELRDNDFSDKETLKGVLQSLGACQTIKSLYLRNNKLTVQSIEALGELLISNKSLREVEIWCKDDSFNAQAIHKVLEALALNKTLKSMTVWCEPKAVKDFKDQGFDFNGYLCEIEISSDKEDLINYTPPNFQASTEVSSATGTSVAKLGSKK